MSLGRAAKTARCADLELIDYSLELPATKTGERLGKTVVRILKHTYRARRVRTQHSKDTLVISARVDKEHLNAIRGAVKMTLMARGIEGELKYAVSVPRPIHSKIQ